MPQVRPRRFQRTLRIETLLIFAAQLTDFCTATCSWSAQGASYDLTDLKLPRLGDSEVKYAWNVTDDNPEVKYFYQFNICGNIIKDPIAQGPCASKDPSPAFQLNEDDGDFCHALGGDFTSGVNYDWSLHDEDDPAGGVVLHYFNGDNDACDNGRKLNLHFICRDDEMNKVPSDEYVEEPSKCEYNMLIYTSYGCPQECRVNGLICGGKGTCGYQRDAKKASCYCDEGYTGPECQKKASSGGGGGVSGNHVALIIVCILLVGVVGLLVYMWSKLRRLQLDPDAYSQLGNRFNELGQVSASS